jgi:hypothetical protein
MQIEAKSIKELLKKLKILMLEEILLQTSVASKNQNIPAFIECDAFSSASRIYTGISTFSFLILIEIKNLFMFYKI